MNYSGDHGIAPARSLSGSTSGLHEARTTIRRRPEGTGGHSLSLAHVPWNLIPSPTKRYPPVTGG